MASSSRRLLLLSTAALLAAVLTAAATSSPGYCVPGQAIPWSPLLACRWYAASRTCAVVSQPPLLPPWHLKDMCCRQLEAIPVECRCRALRAMAAQTPPAVGRACWLAQAQFAPTVVAEAECGLRTVHGIRFCFALRAED